MARHKNGALEISVFPTLYLHTGPVWKLSWPPQWTVSLAARAMQLLAEIPMGSFCDLALQFCEPFAASLCRDIAQGMFPGS